MKFGVMVDTSVDKWNLIQYAEELGYHRAWVPDSQMIWSDCYVTMGLAAANTKRIHIGTGMTTPGTRIAPVTAHSIATINRLAPGRTFLGIGTGNTVMRLIGQDPIMPKEMKEYVHILRKLLDGEEVDYTYRGRTAEIQFMMQDRNYMNVKDRVPIYIAANGPLALAAAGEIGDGWMMASKSLKDAQGGLKIIHGAAEKSNRKLPADYLASALTTTCVLRPGESLSSERVINETGAWVTSVLHFSYEIWQKGNRDDKLILPLFSDVWEDYIRQVDSINRPPRERFREIHDGHCTFVQERERRFVTPKTIRATCMVGEPDDIVEQLRQLERTGVNEIAILPSADTQRGVFSDFATHVMPHFQ